MDDRTSYQIFRNIQLSLPFRISPDIEDCLVRLERQMYGASYRYRTALNDRYVVEQYLVEQVMQARKETLAVAEIYIAQLEDSIAALLKERQGNE